MPRRVKHSVHCYECRETIKSTEYINHLKDHNFGSSPSDPNCNTVILHVIGKYDKIYMLFLAVGEKTTLKHLDSFLRDTWVECCGHLSKFEVAGVIDNEGYEKYESKNEMDCGSLDFETKILDLYPASLNYEYDFGTTTHLIINMIDRVTTK